MRYDADSIAPHTQTHRHIDATRTSTDTYGYVHICVRTYRPLLDSEIPLFTPRILSGLDVSTSVRPRCLLHESSPAQPRSRRGARGRLRSRAAHDQIATRPSRAVSRENCPREWFLSFAVRRTFARLLFSYFPILLFSDIRSFPSPSLLRDATRTTANSLRARSPLASGRALR